MIRDYEASNRVLSCCPHLPSREVRQTPLFLTTALAMEPYDEPASVSLLSALVDALPKGLLVVSPDRSIIYWNQNARRLCQRLAIAQKYVTDLPVIISQLCMQVVELGSLANEPAVLDYQTPDESSFRLTGYWLNPHTSDRAEDCLHQPSYILVMIEDRDEVLHQDMQAEQKKFQLTNREAEIWLLLKREYSYQAIAKTLHISLNTVKTHIRNIHAKRHPYQSLPA